MWLLKSGQFDGFYYLNAMGGNMVDYLVRTVFRNFLEVNIGDFSDFPNCFILRHLFLFL